MGVDSAINQADVTASAESGPRETTVEVPSDASFDALYAANAGKALRLATILTGNLSVAEDVAATAMVKVYRRWRRGGIDDFWPYLRTAIVNEFRSDLRRDRGISASLDDRGDARAEDFVTALADRSRLIDALSALSARQRASIALRYLEDLPEREVARLLRCEVGTVKSNVSRGLVLLRAALSEGESHDG